MYISVHAHACLPESISSLACFCKNGGADEQPHHESSWKETILEIGEVKGSLQSASKMGSKE
jgi:hypothetical protein